MVSKGLTGVGLAHHSGQCDASNYDVQAHIGESRAATPARHTREGGYPVRRGLSVQSLRPLGYWVARPSAQLRTRRATTAVDIPAARFARALPTVSPNQEGAGNAGCLLHPRSRVQEMV